MATANKFKVYRKGEQVTEGQLKSQFDDRYREVLGGRLKQLPRATKRERPKYVVQEDLPSTKEEYDALQRARFTATVESLVDDAFQELEELGNEMREAYDNTPESLQQTDLGERRGEAADALEELANDRPDLPEICSNINVYFLPPKDMSSRPKRASAVQDMLMSAAEELRSYADELEENKEQQPSGEGETGEKEVEEKAKEEAAEEVDPGELHELADQLEDIGGQVGDVEFPGMYG